MFRGTTVRALLALLAAALLALPLLTPGTPFAAAHKVRHVEAKTSAGTKTTGTALRDERATSRDCDPSWSPTGPLRTLDRHRAADSAPEAPECPPLKEDRTTAQGAAVPGTAHSRTPRSSADRTPAALQVFRC